MTPAAGIKAINELSKYFYSLVKKKRNTRKMILTRCSNISCLSDESLVIPMKELQLDDKLNFVEEPVEVMDREIKQLKRSRIPIIKVRWNSKRGPEFTWEREDEIRAKYPHLFSIITSSSIKSRDEISVVCDCRVEAVTFIPYTLAINFPITVQNLKIGRYGVLELNTAYQGCLTWDPRIKYSRIFLSWYGYGVSDLLDMAYRAPLVWRIRLLWYDVLSYSGMVFCTSWVRRIELLGYGVLAESVIFLIFDQSIIYDVNTDVDTAYSSKSCNGLLTRQSLGYVV
ncbi:hypothetical protein Tco_0773162 [Tanacetum coccineum]|uniref:Reverse transcriptase domain-containing protein n=1 Tax=Tanacetum coccineum TaxID=301880 RepID=A0ABQ4ZMJ7_9ASTR